MEWLYVVVGLPVFWALSAANYRYQFGVWPRVRCWPMVVGFSLNRQRLPRKWERRVADVPPEEARGE